MFSSYKDGCKDSFQVRYAINKSIAIQKMNNEIRDRYNAFVTKRNTASTNIALDLIKLARKNRKAKFSGFEVSLINGNLIAKYKNITCEIDDVADLANLDQFRDAVCAELNITY